MHKGTFIQDEVTDFLPGSPATSSRPTALGSVIPFPTPVQTAAAYWLGEDEDADCWESVGVLAVRLVADWSLPRLQVFVAADPEGGEPDRLP